MTLLQIKPCDQKMIVIVLLQVIFCSCNRPVILFNTQEKLTLNKDAFFNYWYFIPLNTLSFQDYDKFDLANEMNELDQFLLINPVENGVDITEVSTVSASNTM